MTNIYLFIRAIFASCLLSQVVPVLLPLIHAISSIRVFVAKDLKNADNRKAAAKSVAEVRFHGPVMESKL